MKHFVVVDSIPSLQQASRVSSSLAARHRAMGKSRYASGGGDEWTVRRVSVGSQMHLHVHVLFSRYSQCCHIIFHCLIHTLQYITVELLPSHL